MATEDCKPDLAEVESFNKSSLKKTEVQEKNQGANQAYCLEKTLNEVSHFPKDNLKHVSTEEKTTLPTKEDIEAEKKSGF